MATTLPLETACSCQWQVSTSWGYPFLQDNLLHGTSELTTKLLNSTQRNTSHCSVQCALCTALHFCREDTLIASLDKMKGSHSFMSEGEEEEEEQEAKQLKKIKLESHSGSILDKIIDPQMGSPLAPGRLFIESFLFLFL